MVVVWAHIIDAQPEMVLDPIDKVARVVRQQRASCTVRHCFLSAIWYARVHRANLYQHANDTTCSRGTYVSTKSKSSRGSIALRTVLRTNCGLLVHEKEVASVMGWNISCLQKNMAFE
jgi:hypothetical protein